MRTQHALERATTAGMIGILVATGVLYLVKAGIMPRAQLWWGLAAAAAIPILSGVVAFVKRYPLIQVAKRIDTSHTLFDRLGTSVEFCLIPDRTDFMRAHIQETLTHLPRVSAKRATPLRWPRDGRALGLLVLCLLLVGLVRFPPEIPRTTPPRPMARLIIAPEDLEPHRELAHQLQKEALEQDQGEVGKLAQELNRLFEQIQKKELTRKELFAKLAELERKLMEGLEGDFDDLLKRLKKMGGTLQKDKLTKEIGKALEQADLKRAKQEMKQLANKLDKLDRKQQERLSRSLDRAAREKLQRDQLERKLNDLERQIRRLKRQLKDQPRDALARRRLQRKQRQLQRLNRQRQRSARQRRQLERLNRQLQRAAAQLRDKLSPEAMKALMKAAQQMGRFADQLTKLKLMGKAQGQLVDLKDLLRRLGKGGKGQKGKLKDFWARAGGKKGACPKGKKCKTALMLEPGGQGGKLVLPLPGDTQGGQGSPSGMPGDGIGDSSDPNLMGKETRLKSRRKDRFVPGQEGQGPTRSEVILGASDQGFSTRSYRRVYHDYTQIIEEVLQREDVPLGYKYYVKQYFRLIKPR